MTNERPIVIYDKRPGCASQLFRFLFVVFLIIVAVNVCPILFLAMLGSGG